MPLQTENLAMVALGVIGDSPPHVIQPPLDDGIHFRWAFDPERGFPWHGYYLFRRLHSEGQPVCIAQQFDPTWAVGSLGVTAVTVAGGELAGDAPLAATELFAGAGVREIDLRGQGAVRFTLPEASPARRFRVEVGFMGRRGTTGEEPAADDLANRKGCLGKLLGPFPPPPPPPKPVRLRITGYDGAVPVAHGWISGVAGQVAEAFLAADRMDSVEIAGGPAALIDICYVPVGQDEGAGWGMVWDFPYPMCLPTAQAGYPCVGRPTTPTMAEALAIGRVRYGQQAPWATPPTLGADPPVTELREAFDALVAGGPPPGGLTMAERSASYPDEYGDPNAPVMPDQRPLDLVLLGAINPAVAQMAGLYFIDDPEGPGAAPGTWAGPGHPGVPSARYDYLLLADHDGLYQGDRDLALAAVGQGLPDAVDRWICFDVGKEASPPLAAPTGLEVFALPGSVTDPVMIAQNRVGAAGLRWRIEQSAEGDLLPGQPVGYHLWRANLGDPEPTAPAAAGDYGHITANRMVMVAAPSPGASAQTASDWPPFSLHKVDKALAEGWYAYQARGQDIFGRISLESAPAVWRQWGPEPEPRPWYYADPAGDAQVNPFAVRLLAKTPPPPAPDVEAWALDPLDPDLAGETAYDGWAATGWWAGLPAAEQARRAGLKVRWRWDAAQMLQAPRTAEFRIYLSPGTDAVPDHHDPLSWPERVYVVDAATHFTPILDGGGAVIGRQYEVLLPEDLAGLDFPGVALEPTDLTPVVYANVGVNAADDRDHTDDAAKWAGTPWGDRPGNQGRIGTAAKIFRVLRTAPAAPPLIGHDDKVWATRADYHNVSRYTVRWARPPAGQKVHIFRTLDDSLYRADHARRGVAGAAAFTMADVSPFGWTPAENLLILNELTGLDAVTTLAWDDPAVRAAYEQLGERALRVLASFEDNAEAFVQITWEPLDPEDPANADRAGPDATEPYATNPAWGAWVAELDGRAANRYFFRAAYLNAAHTVGPLGPSTPAVHLPKVQPPRAPAITKVTCGELSITLTWAHNREPDFVEYRLYRADDPRQARDPRLMTRVATVTETPATLAQPAIDWADTGELVGGQAYLYRLTSVDGQGNESPPSEAVTAVAVDSRVPAAPAWAGQSWMVRDIAGGALSSWPADGIVPAGSEAVVRLRWRSYVPEPQFEVGRRAPGVGPFSLLPIAGEVVDAGAPVYGFVDRSVDPGRSYQYQVRVRSKAGHWSERAIAMPTLEPQ